MTSSDFPGLFSANDEASLTAQRLHFGVLRLQLVIFLAVSAIASITAVVPIQIQRVLPVFNAVLLVSGVLLIYVMRERRYDKTWFDCRAVAESVKTATWRYMMAVSPFPGSMTDVDADLLFVRKLDEIRAARPTSTVTTLTPSQKQITDHMREVRHKPLGSRKELYAQQRLGDQKSWYESKAESRGATAAAWYWAVAGFQAGALVVAIVAASLGPLRFNAVSILMTMAASLTAWTQAKRHEELANSYSLAAQELGGLEAIAVHATDDARFEALVEAAEGAICREHTMWVAKRAQP